MQPGGACLLRAHRVHASSDSPSDFSLLHRYTHAGSQQAFEELVKRHSGWVGAVVRRKIPDKHLAEDVTQAVFIILSRKARVIRPDQVLSAWLFRVARFAVRDALRQEMRRAQRWQRVARLQAQKVNGNSQSMPLEAELDDALACLSESDRQVILLRFYEDLSMAEVGVALGVAEVAAKKRVSRALQRLRAVMGRKEHQLGALALAALLSGIGRSAEAGEIASAHTLAHSLGPAAVGRGEFPGHSLQIAHSTLKTMAGVQSRLWMAMSSGVVAAAIVIGIFSPSMGQDVFSVFQQVSQRMHNAFSLAPEIPVPNPSNAGERSAAPVKNLWVGHANTSGWPVLPLGSIQSPLLLRTTSGSDDPVAIAQDDRGAYWYRRLNQETSFIPSHAQDSQVEIAPAPSSISPYTVDHLTELAHEFFTAAAATASSTGSDWQPIAPQPDGSFHFGFAGMQDPGDGIDVTGTQIVPEPAAGALAMTVAISLVRRRRAPRDFKS